MLVSDFKYTLPEGLIAQEPLADRAASRLLHLDRNSAQLHDTHFREFPDLLRPDDLIVFNNTRVFPARLYGRRSGTQGRIEVLLTHQLSTDPNEWDCLVRPGRKIGVGEQLSFGDHDELQAEVTARAAFGERRIRFHPVADFFSAIDRLGHIPLPPYINRNDSPSDRNRYQTIYARERGSIAAPTAGLHFTPEILARLKQRGIETTEITLHIGLGTFQPVRVDRVEDHRLHQESYSITPQTAQALNRALDARRRIVAIGTTTVRTLEYAARAGRIQPESGEAALFIYPGYNFRVVGAMLTNFHLPESTLLMLVCTLGGQEKVLQAYRHAVAQKYRFYSYGDCMFLE